MSYQIGIDTVNLKPTPRLAHTEYCSSDPIRRAVHAATSYFAGPREQNHGCAVATTGQPFEDIWDLDLIWHTDDGPVFIQHDDFVWSSGPFLHPAFYRSAIIPRYAQLWKVLHSAGKKVLFCADADWSMFVSDIADAGADGFIFEPMLPLEGVVERFGKTHVIVGSKVDCRTMTFGDKEAVRQEIDATLKLAKDCPGFFCAVGNHIPANVPVDTALFYMDYLHAHWSR